VIHLLGETRKWRERADPARPAAAGARGTGRVAGYSRRAAAAPPPPGFRGVGHGGARWGACRSSAQYCERKWIWRIPVTKLYPCARAPPRRDVSN
jgi:hypothetical protein